MAELPVIVDIHTHIGRLPGVVGEVVTAGPAGAGAAAVEGLRGLAGRSPEACRTLVDLLYARADAVNAAAQKAVGSLMAAGVMRRVAGGWEYHGRTHHDPPPRPADRRP